MVLAFCIKSSYRFPRGFSIYYFLLTSCKTVGGIISLVVLHSSTFNEGLYIGAYILESISLGFELRALSCFTDHFYHYHDIITNPIRIVEVDKEKLEDSSTDSLQKIKKQKIPLFHPFTILTFIVIAGIVCTAVGASNAVDSSSPPPEMKAGGIIFLVASVIMIGLYIHLAITSPALRVLTFPSILTACVLIVRSIYVILVSFNKTGPMEPSKYTLIFGEYKYFLALVVIMEAIIVVLLIVNMYLFVTKVRVPKRL